MKIKILEKLSKVSDEPEWETKLLLAHVLKVEPKELFLKDSLALTGKQQKELETKVKRRLKREPLAYILGEWEFFGIKLKVNKNVLIPRPETEGLVREVLSHYSLNPNSYILDVGTGSGAIAITLAKNIDNVHVIATDVSEKALILAKCNVRLNQVANKITFVKSNLLKNIPYSLYPVPYILISNLPYIPSSRIKTLSPEVQHEPRNALDGGKDGFDLYRKLLDQIARLKVKPELIVLEIDHTQGTLAQKEIKNRFPNSRVKIGKDMSGLDRYITLSLNYRRKLKTASN